MMNEMNIIGKSWTRVNKVLIENPTPYVAPSVRFFEEEFTEMSNGITSVKPGDEVKIEALDPSMVVVCVNPDTLEPTGETMTVGSLHTAIVGLWKSISAQPV